MTFYNQHSTALVGAAGQPQGHFLEDSLRLRSSASAYLNRTPASAGNRTTWTFSFWAKRGALGSDKIVLSAGTTGSTDIDIFFPSDLFMISDRSGFNVKTTSVYRDPSAWYHFVVKFDTTQSTASDRIKLYVNGLQITSLDGATSYPAQNATSSINNNVAHYIGTRSLIDNRFDGYLTEVNFIDGQALDPSYFGETDTVTGVWKPIEYTGSYGTNGFYLPMTPTSQAEGFNTVLYKGTGATQSITGVGFSPDFVWIKTRSNVASHSIFDSIRGVNNWLASDSPDAAFGGQTDLLTSFGSDGFSLGANTGSKTVNKSGQNFVAWCWDAGSGSPASNTDGSITSTVKANQAKGFSIVSYTGTGSNATVGHGLGTSPSMIIVKNRAVSSNWYVGHDGVNPTSPWSYRMILQDVDARTNDGAAWNDTAPTSSVFSIGTSGATNGSGNAMIAYCFSEVAGYSKIGSYTGNGSSSGPTITTGFRPAWVMIKRTDAADEWAITDNTRNPNNPTNLVLFANLSNAESGSHNIVSFSDTGFQVVGTPTWSNASGGTYIYMAFADTRDTAFNNDASGNKNNWTPNNINSNASGQSTYDLMKDVPTLTSEDASNFCTMNPVDKNDGSYSDGNLGIVTGTVGGSTQRGSIYFDSGKYYWEYLPISNGGISAPGFETLNNGTYTPQFYQADNGLYYNGGGTISYGATFGNNDLIGIAVDADNRTVEFFKNGVSQGLISSANSGISVGDTIIPFVSDRNVAQTTTAAINFGQRPFAYTPPTGFKKLNTYNLPDPTIKDGSDYFNTVLYTGNASSSRDITGVGFQPDFVWFKERSVARFHRLFDVIRGTGKKLYTNDTSAELTTTTELNGFLSDGFNIGSDAGVNQNGETYVAWNWKANSSGVSNTDGSITSTVSANTSSGFSVVTYTGDGSNANRTVGHGLGVAPEMVIVKTRSEAARNWLIWHKDLTNYDYALLFTTDAQAANRFGPSAPTSSVFGVYGGQGNRGTETFVSYCFAPIAGYSAFGKYTGNGSTDGPFVYTGFRPAFIIFKRSDAAASWRIMDTSRSPINATQIEIYPNLSNAEAGAANGMDIVSNGFKLRGSYAEWNGSGGTYIYMAFAENPFKYSLAR
jgi:hypothetical protein